MIEFNFSKKQRIIFYSSYIYSRIKLPLDVEKGLSTILIAEFIWVLSRVFKFKPVLNKKFLKNYFETKYGKFYINPDLISTIVVSPSFEAREMEELLELIKNEARNKKRILFIDVGAYFGLYTIAVGKKFKNYKKLDIISFEPDTYYLSKPTYNLLKENIRINKLKRVKIYHHGLGDTNSKIENEVGVKTKKLDSVINFKKLKKYDSVFMKIDVDGYEISVLKGSNKFIKESNNLTILIEDFVENKITKYLQKDFIFISKPSIYNSFWQKK